MRLSKRILTVFAAVLGLISVPHPGKADLAFSFISSTDVAVSGSNYSPSGSLNLTLGFAPIPGTNLTVVNNTGLPFLSGTFDGVPQGGTVPLSYNGTTYNYIANYYGGNGRSLVLEWPCIGLAAWGAGGKLGNNSWTGSRVPVAVIMSGVLAGKTVVAIAGGGAHALALTSEGKVFSWGSNQYGELGVGGTNDSIVPVAANLGNNTVVAIAAGESHSMALTSDGKVLAWGDNSCGQLGADSQLSLSSDPLWVSTSGVLSGKTVVSIAGGGYHSLALTSDGEVFAWGDNSQGALGNFTTTNSPVPVAVYSGGYLSGKKVVSIAAGSNHSLASTSDGLAFGWGENNSGGLGINAATSYPLLPVRMGAVGGLSNKIVEAIAAGYGYSLALTSEGTLFSTGQNNTGQLGVGGADNCFAPVAVSTSGVLSGKGVRAVQASHAHTIAITSDGLAVAWGENGAGQLGNNSSEPTLVAVGVNTSGVLSGKRVVSIATGWLYSVATFGSGPPSVTANPMNQTVRSGTTVYFAAAATNNPASTVQWQVSTTGTAGTFSDVADNATATTGTLTLVNVSTDQDGQAYRAVFTNNAGTGTTTAATLTVNDPPIVTGNPASQTVTITTQTTATFSAMAAGYPMPSIQWQVSQAGIAGPFSNITNNPSATESTLTLPNLTTAQNGYVYRAIFTNAAGSSTTSTAILTVVGPPLVTTSPTSQSVRSGSTAAFTGLAIGGPTPTVQWQVSTMGVSGPFIDITDNATSTSGTLILTNITPAQTGCAYQAVFTNASGNCATTAAILTVNWPVSVTSNPLSQTAASGSAAIFAAAADGNPAPSVQWQVSSTGAGGPFSNITGNVTASTGALTLDGVTPSQNGYAYRAVFSNSSGTGATTAAVLTVLWPPLVTANPLNRMVTSGSTAIFSSTATGNPAPTVQWQVSVTGTMGVFSDIIDNATATTGTLTLANPSLALDGYAYQAVFTNSLGSSTSTAATLRVTANLPPSVTLNPTSQTVKSGSTALFAAGATGNPAPDVQWQISSTGTGGTFSNITGNAAATTGTLALTGVTSTQNGYAYRAVFSNSSGSSTTTAATLTVNWPPSVTANPVSQTVSAGSTVYFSASATGNPAPSIHWVIFPTGTNVGGVGITGTPTSTTGTLGVTNVTAAQNGSTYRAVFVNSEGTTAAQTASLTVTGPPPDFNPFSYAIYTNQDMNLGFNGLIASFNSTATGGLPPPTYLPIDDSDPAGLHDHARIATNSYDLPAISAFWVTVLGSAFTPTGTAGVASYDDSILGGIYSHPPIPLAQMPQPHTTDYKQYDNSGTIKVSGTTYIHAHSLGSVTFTGTGNVTVVVDDYWDLNLPNKPQYVNVPATVHATMYVGGSIKFGQASVNCGPGNSNVARNLVVIGTGTSGPPTLSMNGIGSVAMAFYGPAYDISVKGDTLLMGSVVANSLYLYNSVHLSFFYDEALEAQASQPVVIVNPSNTNAMPGNSAGFTALATGFPPPTIQWQVSSTGTAGGFSNITGNSSATTDALSLPSVTAAQNGYAYRAVFTNSSGTSTTAAAILTVGAPSITSNPVSKSAIAGADVSFSAAATGSPSPTVQWQLSTTGTGGAFSNITGNASATTGTLTLTSVTTTQNGYAYRAVFTNIIGSGTTKGAILTVNRPPLVTASPANQIVSSGSTAIFTSAATGLPFPSVQWQASATGTAGIFSNMTGNASATTTTLVLTNVSSAQNGNAYRAVFSNVAGTGTTAAATLGVYIAPVITIPADIALNATCKDGAVVAFNVSANDGIDGALIPICLPPSGSLFPIGISTVQCLATNSGGLSASGSFSVTVRRSFSAFQGQYELVGIDPAADPNHTGISNLVAYAFGINPAIPDRSQLPTVAFQNGKLQISYQRWKDAGDLSYVVEVSSDLQNWDSGTDYIGQVSVIPIDDVRELVTERDLIPATNAMRRFIRIRLIH